LKVVVLCYVREYQLTTTSLPTERCVSGARLMTLIRSIFAVNKKHSDQLL